MTENQALPALRGMGDEGITLSPSSRLLSAQFWWGQREGRSETIRWWFCSFPALLAGFPAGSTQRQPHHQKPEESVVQNQGKGQGNLVEMKRSEEVQHY